MSILFITLTVISLISALFQGKSADVTKAVMESGSQAIEYILSVGAVIIVYSGIMNIANKAGLCNALSRLLRPILTKLFGKLDDNTLRDITMNVSCNVLGLGNAATPYGLSAIKAMSKGEVATNPMILFVVINTSSLQLLPTTVAAIRQSAGSVSPFDILPCVWLCSVASVVMAVLCCKIFERIDAACKT